MCGISALFSSSGEVRPDYIVDMNNLIRHRGLDGEGFFLKSLTDIKGGAYCSQDTPSEVLHSLLPYCPKNHISHAPAEKYSVALGHRRLAIIDLAATGHQPMSLYDNVWITYNGEIYNYLEVREELMQMGYRFITNSDTEVILCAYLAWGIECLQKFNGMFAFVIYDARKERIFAARDRFGVKPLYFWRSPKGLLAFASEIKQFTVLPGWDPHLNAQRAYDFLNWGLLDHTEETMFKSVNQLRGGELIDISLHENNVQPKRWYHLQAKPFEGDFQMAAKQFRFLLEDAVRLRLRADVAIGSCLSGGLDSSGIVCLAKQILGETGNQKTFSACSIHKRFDEKEFIDAIVASQKMEAFYTYPDIDELLEESSAILWHQDEPYPTTSVFAQWLVFKMVKKEKVKVMLDGQGADEQLGGYHGFFGNRIYDLFSKGDFMGMLKEIQCIKNKHPRSNPWMLLFNKLVPDTLRQPIRRMLGKSAAGSDWLDMNMLQAQDIHPFHEAKHHGFHAQSILQILHTSVPMLLHFEDRDSMAHSVESRTPFLDYRLVEFNLGLPGHFKIHEGWTKHVMREGMKDILPPSICWRMDKMGFLTAEEEWVCRERPAEFMCLVEESLELSQGIFKPKVRDLALRMMKGKLPYNSTLWRQITFSKWLELFDVSVF